MSKILFQNQATTARRYTNGECLPFLPKGITCWDLSSMTTAQRTLIILAISYFSKWIKVKYLASAPKFQMINGLAKEKTKTHPKSSPIERLGINNLVNGLTRKFP